MHNLHFAVVKARDGKEACRIVEHEIQNFGDENNWHSIGGGVAEDDEIYINDTHARWLPADCNEDGSVKEEGARWSWADIEAWVNRLIDEPDKYLREMALTAAAWLLAGGNIKELPTATSYGAREYWNWAQHVGYMFGEPFTLAGNYSFHGGEYSQNGATIMDRENPAEPEEGEPAAKLWAVFIDMHD